MMEAGEGRVVPTESGQVPEQFFRPWAQMSDYLSIDSKACYSIQVQGVLDQNWVDQFGELKAITVLAKDGLYTPVTTIIGEVVDQSALFGLLNLVYDLGLPLLSATHLGRT